jgi:hypothetical protein
MTRRILLALAVALLAPLAAEAAEPVISTTGTITATETITIRGGGSEFSYVVAYVDESPPLYCRIDPLRGRDCADLLAGKGLYVDAIGRLRRDRGGAWRIAVVAYDLSPSEHVDQ